MTTQTAEAPDFATVALTVNRACRTCGSPTSPEHGHGYFDQAGTLLCRNCDTPVVREDLGVVARVLLE